MRLRKFIQGLTPTASLCSTGVRSLEAFVSCAARWVEVSKGVAIAILVEFLGPYGKQPQGRRLHLEELVQHICEGTKACFLKAKKFLTAKRIA